MREYIAIVEAAALTESFSNALFHGTDLFGAILILEDNTIKAHASLDGSSGGDPHGVSLTRDYRLAAKVGEWYDRAFPVVFVLDADRLKSRFKVTPRRDPNADTDEKEEFVSRDIAGIEQYIVSINTDASIFDDLIDEAETHTEIFDETKSYDDG